MKRDPRSGPVPAPWATDAVARARGGVAISHPRRLDCLDGGWSMDDGSCKRMRRHILSSVDQIADEDGSVALTVVDLEARSELERVPGRSPRRIMRSRSNSADDGAEALA